MLLTMKCKRNFATVLVVLAVNVFFISGTCARPHDDQEDHVAEESRSVDSIQYDDSDIVPPGESPFRNLNKVQRDRQYVNFINELYRFDKTKSALTFDAAAANHQAGNHNADDNFDLRPHYDVGYDAALHSGQQRAHRQKRTLIFRPMFVYRQQQVKRERQQEEKKKQQDAAAAAVVAANKANLYKDKQNKQYKEYNSFYEPYRYGPRYPYRP